MYNHTFCILVTTRSEPKERSSKKDNNRKVGNFWQSFWFFNPKEIKSLTDYTNSFENGPFDESLVHHISNSQKLQVISNLTETNSPTDWKFSEKITDICERTKLTTEINYDLSPVSESPFLESCDFPLDFEISNFSSQDFSNPDKRVISNPTKHSFQVNLAELIEQSKLKDQLHLERKKKAKERTRRIRKDALKREVEAALSFLEKGLLKFPKKAQDEISDSNEPKTDKCDISEKYLEECLIASEKQNFMLKLKKSAVEKDRLSIDFAEENIPFSISESFPLRIAVDLNYLSRKQKKPKTTTPNFILFTILDGLQLWQSQHLLWEVTQTENEFLLGYGF